MGLLVHNINCRKMGHGSDKQDQDVTTKWWLTSGECKIAIQIAKTNQRVVESNKMVCDGQETFKSCQTGYIN